MGAAESTKLEDKNVMQVSLQRSREISRMDKSVRSRVRSGILYNMKVVIRGERGSGKSSLMKRLQGQKLSIEYSPTPEIETAAITWDFRSHEDVAKVEVWDVVDKGLTADNGSYAGLEGAVRGHLSASGPKQGLHSIAALDASVVDVYQGAHAVIFMINPFSPTALEYLRQQETEVPKGVAILILVNFRDCLHRQNTDPPATPYAHPAPFGPALDSMRAAATWSYAQVLARDMQQARRIRHPMAVGVTSAAVLEETYFSVPFLRLKQACLLEQLERSGSDLQEAVAATQVQRTVYPVYAQALLEKQKLKLDHSTNASEQPLPPLAAPNTADPTSFAPPAAVLTPSPSLPPSGSIGVESGLKLNHPTVMSPKEELTKQLQGNGQVNGIHESGDTAPSGYSKEKKQAPQKKKSQQSSIQVSYGGDDSDGNNDSDEDNFVKPKKSSRNKSKDKIALAGPSATESAGQNKGSTQDVNDVSTFVPTLGSSSGEYDTEAFLRDAATDDNDEDPRERALRENRMRVAACLKQPPPPSVTDVAPKGLMRVGKKKKSDKLLEESTEPILRNLPEPVEAEVLSKEMKRGSLAKSKEKRKSKKDKAEEASGEHSSVGGHVTSPCEAVGDVPVGGDTSDHTTLGQEPLPPAAQSVFCAAPPLLLSHPSKRSSDIGNIADNNRNTSSNEPIFNIDGDTTVDHSPELSTVHIDYTKDNSNTNDNADNNESLSINKDQVDYDSENVRIHVEVLSPETVENASETDISRECLYDSSVSYPDTSASTPTLVDPKYAVRGTCSTISPPENIEISKSLSGDFVERLQIDCASEGSSGYTLDALDGRSSDEADTASCTPQSPETYISLTGESEDPRQELQLNPPIRPHLESTVEEDLTPVSFDGPVVPPTLASASISLDDLRQSLEEGIDDHDVEYDSPPPVLDEIAMQVDDHPELSKNDSEPQPQTTECVEVATVLSEVDSEEKALSGPNDDTSLPQEPASQEHREVTQLSGCSSDNESINLSKRESADDPPEESRLVSDNNTIGGQDTSTTTLEPNTINSSIELVELHEEDATAANEETSAPTPAVEPEPTHYTKEVQSVAPDHSTIGYSVTRENLSKQGGQYLEQSDSLIQKPKKVKEIRKRKSTRKQQQVESEDDEPAGLDSSSSLADDDFGLEVGEPIRKPAAISRGHGLAKKDTR